MGHSLILAARFENLGSVGLTISCFVAFPLFAILSPTRIPSSVAKAPGSSVVRRSKLHLVDLAGSERIGKTGVEGNLLSEAKYINLSLHYLEQVTR